MLLSETSSGETLSNHSKQAHLRSYSGLFSESSTKKDTVGEVEEQQGEQHDTIGRKRAKDSSKGTLSQGIRAFGLRQARYLGQAKTHLQHVFIATAINVTRLLAWLDDVPFSTTRTSRFAALAP